MRFCRLSLRREGVLGICRLVVSLFRRCITFCKECKLYSRWHLPSHSKQHMVVCGLSLHQGSTESRKTLEDKVQKSIAEALNRDREAGWIQIKPKMIQKKISSSLSRQSSETKPWAKLVLVSWEQLFYLEFTNPINKMFLRLVYLKNSTFPSLQITVDTLIDIRNETSKHHFLNQIK